ncbi:MAG TPA: hypothetical protein VH682_01150, partial [Gemmataceae bacterium]
TILIPGTPVQHTRTIGAITTTHYQVERKKESATFEVAFFDLPAPFLPPTILDDMAKGARANALPLLKSTVSSHSSIFLGDLPGREDQFKLPTRGTFITRIYLAKVGNTHRVYMVMAGGQSIQPNKDDAARFFDSFKLTAPATPPTFAGAAGEGGPQPPVVNPPPANPQPNPPRTIPRPRPPQGPRRER